MTLDNSRIAELYETWETEELARCLQQERLKDLFAEAKDQGLNPKALRNAFRHKFSVKTETEDQRQKRERTDDETSIYIEALARVRMRVREDEPEHDPETGEITEPAEPTPRVQAETSEGAADALSPSGVPNFPATNDGGRDENAPDDSEAVIDRRRRQHDEQNSEEPAHDLGAIARPADQVTTEPDQSNAVVTPPIPTEAERIAQRVLPRQPGCQHPDECAGTWRARCGTCERAWVREHSEAAVL